MTLKHESLLSRTPTAAATAKPTITHPQLRHLLNCPQRRGIVYYVSEFSILERDLLHPTIPPRTIVEFDFLPTCFTTISLPSNPRALLFAAGGTISQLYLSLHEFTHSSSITPPAPPSERWGYFAPKGDQQEIINYLFFSPAELTDDTRLPPATASPCGYPSSGSDLRLVACGNDMTLRFFDVIVRDQGKDEPRLLPCGFLSLETCVNHASISPDGRTLLCAGDTPNAYLFRIIPGASVVFEPLAIYTIPMPPVGALDEICARSEASQTIMPTMTTHSTHSRSAIDTPSTHPIPSQVRPPLQTFPPTLNPSAHTPTTYTTATSHVFPPAQPLIPPRACFSTAWTSDGLKFALAAQEGALAVWDVRSSAPVWVFWTGLRKASEKSGGNRGEEWHDRGLPPFSVRDRAMPTRGDSDGWGASSQENWNGWGMAPRRITQGSADDRDGSWEWVDFGDTVHTTRGGGAAAIGPGTTLEPNAAATTGSGIASSFASPGNLVAGDARVRPVTLPLAMSFDANDSMSNTASTSTFPNSARAEATPASRFANRFAHSGPALIGSETVFGSLATTTILDPFPPPAPSTARPRPVPRPVPGPNTIIDTQLVNNVSIQTLPDQNSILQTFSPPDMDLADGNGPDSGIRNIQFSTGEGGRELCVFVEHTTHIHVIDARTFDPATHQVFVFPDIRTLVSAWGGRDGDTSDGDHSADASLAIRWGPSLDLGSSEGDESDRCRDAGSDLGNAAVEGAHRDMELNVQVETEESVASNVMQNATPEPRSRRETLSGTPEQQEELQMDRSAEGATLSAVLQDGISEALPGRERVLVQENGSAREGDTSMVTPRPEMQVLSASESRRLPATHQAAIHGRDPESGTTEETRFGFRYVPQHSVSRTPPYRVPIVASRRGSSSIFTGWGVSRPHSPAPPAISATGSAAATNPPAEQNPATELHRRIREPSAGAAVHTIIRPRELSVHAMEVSDIGSSRGRVDGLDTEVNLWANELGQRRRTRSALGEGEIGGGTGDRWGWGDPMDWRNSWGDQRMHLRADGVIEHLDADGDVILRESDEHEHGNRNRSRNRHRNQHRLQHRNQNEGRETENANSSPGAALLAPSAGTRNLQPHLRPTPPSPLPPSLPASPASPNLRVSSPAPPPPRVIESSEPHMPVRHISGLCFDPTGEWVYVAGEGGIVEWRVSERKEARGRGGGGWL